MKAALTLATLTTAIVMATAGPVPSQDFDPPRTFELVEATIPELVTALETHRINSKQLVKLYLDRIATYEGTLNAFITVNPDAIAVAHQRDVERAQGRLRGPLHGIPIVLKDNVHTLDMKTTGGALAGTYPNPGLAAGSVDNAAIAFAAVTNSKLAADSVSSSKIASGAVGNSDLANAAVTSDKIAGGAVDTSKIASDSITRSKMAGGYSNGAVAFTVGANDCNDYNLSIPGAQLNDLLLFNLQSSAALPPNMLIQPLRVVAADTVQVRVCNIGNTTQSTGDMGIYLLTIR